MKAEDPTNEKTALKKIAKTRGLSVAQVEHILDIGAEQLKYQCVPELVKEGARSLFWNPSTGKYYVRMHAVDSYIRVEESSIIEMLSSLKNYPSQTNEASLLHKQILEYIQENRQASRPPKLSPFDGLAVRRRCP